MNRYATTKRKKDSSGVTVYGTTYYPKITLQNSDKFIVTKEGDRLDTLAHKFYGDHTLWWVISKASGIKGKVGLKAGTPLRIPGNISKIVEQFHALNR